MQQIIGPLNGPQFNVNWEELYYLALCNAKKSRTSTENWVHVCNHGVGSTKAITICKHLGVDPHGTEFKRKEVTPK